VRQVRIQVVRWRVRLEPRGTSGSDLHSDGSDGRLLSLAGYASLLQIPSGMDPGMQKLLAITYGGVIRCELSLHPSRSREAVEADCDGFACRYAEESDQPQLLAVSIGLPPPLWEELWTRSRSPPPECSIGFSIVGLDVGAGVVDLTPTDQKFRVVSPFVEISSPATPSALCQPT
jgi:hypothetical protein